ncbi:class I SAM-dependent methyltransferase [archaeon]|nr:class I SAM-dependent methyltransferase [archaeon]MBL7057096.1 class I SAM-dependent methyltransferase [Candidatus Woesearchaeota archaeon]
MTEKMRDFVKSGYNKGMYSKVYSRDKNEFDTFEKFMCDNLISRLKKDSKILDLGCGIGLPYDKYFCKNKFLIVGVDSSKKHILKARKNVPEGKFLVDDFFSKEVKGKFDAIVSFYSIFHIPRNEHKKLFVYINSLLKKDGCILITLGVDSMKYVVNENFVGSPMAWSSYNVKKNKQLVQDAGFKIILCAEDYRTERHLWILARKK